MSPTLATVLIAFFAALAPTITAIATLRQGKRIIAKADIIHDLTNSNLSAVKSDLAQAKQQIVDLQALVASLISPKKD